MHTDVTVPDTRLRVRSNTLHPLLCVYYLHPSMGVWVYVHVQSDYITVWRQSHSVYKMLAHSQNHHFSRDGFGSHPKIGDLKPRIPGDTQNTC